MSPDLHTTAGKIEDLREKIDEAIHAGSARAVEKQHAKGKHTARERIEMLVDPDSFTEIDEFARHRSNQFGMEKSRPYGDGVVIGTATVDGRPIALYSQDFTVFGGSLGEVHAEKIVKIAEFALKSGIPLIGINDSGGARIQEGVASLNGYGKIFRLNTRSSGVIPQISLILGPCAGGSAYSPALTDFTVMVKETSNMFITGPDVIKTVTGEDVDMEELGGAFTHNTKSGNSHYMADSEADAIDYVKALLSYLPSNNMDGSPVLPATETLARFARFEDVLELIRHHRDVKLLVDVETSLKLVSYSPGRIEFEPTEKAPRDLAQRLGSRLQTWTGQRWAVSIGTNGASTIAELRDAAALELKEQAKAHPLVQAVLVAFPKAQISDIRTAKDIAAEAQIDALPEVEDEWDPFDDE